MSQAMEALNRPNPNLGWAGKFDPDTRASLTKFGTEIGFTNEELANTTHPLMIQTLNLAKIGFDYLKKQRATSAKPPAPAANPVPEVGTVRSAPVIRGVDDRLPIDEWMKRRYEHLQRKKAAR
jgi:hypothetical protein